MKLVDMLDVIHKLKSTEGTSVAHFFGSGIESNMDVLALLGEDAGLQTLPYHTVCALNLPVRVGVGDCCPVYPNVVIVTEI
jgi:hypothetical protein